MLEFGEPLKPRNTTKPLVFFLCIFWAEGRGWFVVVVLCCVVLCCVLVFTECKLALEETILLIMSI